MMQNPPFDQLYHSIHYPERAFNLYLCSSEINPCLLSDFNAYQVPPAFSKPLVYLLFETAKRSGFSRLNIETEILKKGPKLRVRWGAGTSEQSFLDESELRMLKQLAKDYFQAQVSKYSNGLRVQ